MTDEQKPAETISDRYTEKEDAAILRFLLAWELPEIWEKDFKDFRREVYVPAFGTSRTINGVYMHARRLARSSDNVKLLRLAFKDDGILKHPMYDPDEETMIKGFLNDELGELGEGGIVALASFLHFYNNVFSVESVHKRSARAVWARTKMWAYSKLKFEPFPAKKCPKKSVAKSPEESLRRRYSEKELKVLEELYEIFKTMSITEREAWYYEKTKVHRPWTSLRTTMCKKLGLKLTDAKKTTPPKAQERKTIPPKEDVKPKVIPRYKVLLMELEKEFRMMEEKIFIQEDPKILAIAKELHLKFCK